MLRRILLCLALLIGTPYLAMAQRFKGVELFGGYSQMNFNIKSTYSPFYFPLVRFGDNVRLSGWHGAFTEEINDWIGLTQQFEGYYGTHDLQGTPNHFSSFSVLSGPRFSYRGIKVVTPFAHALFGYGQTTVKLTQFTNATASGQYYQMEFGGGFDIHIYGHFGIRPVEIDYVHTSFINGQSNLSYTAGIFFRWTKSPYGY